ncbi:Aqualysin-1 [Rhizoctonia solani]|uniref:Aqualysin-1 n=1 Tax=Rhizoctonia solani TaxID=456999 RepID=A0A0K6G4C4_9AGAM|nr:Aqualysin-1 [Rhizoctonia solani]
MRTAFIVSALAFVIPALGAPTVIPISKRSGPIKPNSYVVKFKDLDDAASRNVLQQLAERLRTSDSSITHTYTVWPGFAAILKGDNLEYVRRMSEIESVEQDSILSLLEHEVAAPDSVPPMIAGYHDSLVGRDGDPESPPSGQGVTIYGIDTGIYTPHECFGGRATVGHNWITAESDQDEHGHGTHTAGTAACTKYGGAGGAKVIALKVLNKAGSGSLSDVMAGVDWAYNDFKTENKLAIATMSLGSRNVEKTALDSAVQNAINGGLHFTIAAGNDGLDAQTSSPAHVKDANTIGAVDSNKNNEQAYFSNHGTLIDVWAPGVNIKSAWIGNPKAENTISGTSMATPHVAGILAVALSGHGQMNPADLTEELKLHAAHAVKLTTGALTSNDLLAQKWPGPIKIGRYSTSNISSKELSIHHILVRVGIDQTDPTQRRSPKYKISGAVGYAPYPPGFLCKCLVSLSIAMRTAFILSALAFVTPALSAPTVVPITKHAGPVKPDSYIVKLKDGASKNAVLVLLTGILKLTNSLIVYDACDSNVFNGFTSILKGDALAFVQRMQEVEYIEQDGIVSLVEHDANPEFDPLPHGAADRDELTRRVDYGAGVTIYGIDTGIYTEHSCFGGRASFGASFVDKSDGESDMNGHGTHTAATAVCQGYGIATGSNIIAVKVLDGTGSGSTSGVLAGVCWAFNDFKQNEKKRSIATMSLGGAPSPSLNGVVSKAIGGGLHFTIAAGNSNSPAVTSSPANVEAANTIGAVDQNNQKASFSNYGKLIDVWAPGVNIVSAWIGSPDAVKTLSGTSMATPHVAGILAVALGAYGQMTPDKLTSELRGHANPVVTYGLSDIAKSTSTNLLAQKWYKLKEGVSKDAHLNALLSASTAGSSIEYKYEQVFQGYAATLKGKDLDYVRQSKDVEYILEDGIFTIQYEQGDEAAALKRMAEEAETAVVPEKLSKRANGSGVVVYGIDTGIYTAHSTFGGRASWGATFGGYANADGNGHGTHTAGTAVGTTYGVATSAKIVAIKVLSDAGSGAYSDIIAGVNWVVSNKGSSPAVATMSLGGSANSALDSAISSAIGSGVHFTIAAGNSNVDAANTSPARVAAANTVGAVDSSNRKASFSNYGSVLDVWALGVNVLSAWIGSTAATNTISGTSMATPRVAGILAVALGDYGSVTPASLSASLKSHASALVTGAPSGTTNLLAQRW